MAKQMEGMKKMMKVIENLLEAGILALIIADSTGLPLAQVRGIKQNLVDKSKMDRK